MHVALGVHGEPRMRGGFRMYRETQGSWGTWECLGNPKYMECSMGSPECMVCLRSQQPPHSHGHVLVTVSSADDVVPIDFSLEDENSHHGQRGQTWGPGRGHVRPGKGSGAVGAHGGTHPRCRGRA